MVNEFSLSPTEAQLTGRRRYLRVSTDHEVIGVQFLVTSLAFFIIGGLMALIIRAEQALPGFDFLGGRGLQPPVLQSRLDHDLPRTPAGGPRTNARRIT